MTIMAAEPALAAAGAEGGAAAGAGAAGGRVAGGAGRVKTPGVRTPGTPRGPKARPAAKGKARSKAGTRTTARGTTVVRGSGGSQVSTSQQGRQAMTPQQRQRPIQPDRASKKFSGDDQDKSRRDDRDRGRELVGSVADASVYVRILIAEYLAIMLILAATEIIGPVGQGKKTPTGAEAVTRQTKSFSGLLVRMTATSILFFILALSANGPKGGKIAAALGGLVTLGAAFNAGPVFVALGRIFGSTAGAKHLASGATGTTQAPGTSTAAGRG